MKFGFSFNFPTVNESNKTKFVIHSCECTCRRIKTFKKSFWTECFNKFADAEKNLRKLIEKFGDSDFELSPCKGIKKLKT